MHVTVWALDGTDLVIYRDGEDVARFGADKLPYLMVDIAKALRKRSQER